MEGLEVAMLSRVIGWFRARYAPVLPPAPAYVPSVPTRREPSPEAASDHYPPLQHKVGLGHPDAAAVADDFQPGDEVWSFCSPPEDWQAKCGRKGVALVRNGVVVQSVATILN